MAMGRTISAPKMKFHVVMVSASYLSDAFAEDDVHGEAREPHMVMASPRNVGEWWASRWGSEDGYAGEGDGMPAALRQVGFRDGAVRRA